MWLLQSPSREPCPEKFGGEGREIAGRWGLPPCPPVTLPNSRRRRGLIHLAAKLSPASPCSHYNRLWSKQPSFDLTSTPSGARGRYRVSANRFPASLQQIRILLSQRFTSRASPRDVADGFGHGRLIPHPPLPTA